jgi:hypothetical protein
MKRIIVLLVLALMSVMALGQTSRNDWTATDGRIWTRVWSDGVTRSYRMEYSPSTMVRTGDQVSVTMASFFTDPTPPIFYQINLNCKLNQYEYAIYNTSVTPTKLGPYSEWKQVVANSAGGSVAPILCRAAN